MIIPISIVIPCQKKDSKIYLWTQVRDSGDELSGLLEFPGGKVEAGESPAMAAVREVKEEVGVLLEASKLIKFKNYSNESGRKTIMLMAFLHEDVESVFNSASYIELEKLLEISEKLPPANREILLDLEQSLQDICVKTDT